MLLGSLTLIAIVIVPMASIAFWRGIPTVTCALLCSGFHAILGHGTRRLHTFQSFPLGLELLLLERFSPPFYPSAKSYITGNSLHSLQKFLSCLGDLESGLSTAFTCPFHFHLADTFAYFKSLVK